VKRTAFQSTALTYQAAELVAQTTISVQHTLLRDFSFGMKRLVAHLDESADEELWRAPLALLKRYWFFLLSAPVRFDLDLLLDQSAMSGMIQNLAMYAAVDPVAADLLKHVGDLASQLSVLSDNPLLNALVRSYPKGLGDTLLLLRGSRLVPSVEKLLRRHPATSSARVVTKSQLKEDIHAKRLIVIGAASWFPDFVIQAPRAEEVVVVRYEWIREQRREKSRFIDGWALRDPSKAVASAEVSTTEYDNADLSISASELVSPIDWAQIHAITVGNEHPGDIEDVSARLAVLDGGFAVYVEEDPSATVLTINLDVEDQQQRVARLAASQLRVGMFIVLRSSGGSDYVVTMADKLMGQNAALFRSQQQDWKSKLRTMVRKSSLLEVSVSLLDAGSTPKAYETNVRNWISVRNIKTSDYADFAAIMKVVELAEKTDEYWNSMSNIARHHQRAGQQIRRLLLRRLQVTDLTDLQRLGYLDISLPEAGAGTLTAFRIVALEPTARLISVNQLNHPFEIGGAYATDAAL